MNRSLAFALALAACAHSPFPPLDMKALPGAAKYPGDHAVHLLDAMTVRFLADPTTKDAIAEVDTHQQTRLLRGAGLKGVSVSYSRTFSKVARLEGRVVLPDGTSRDADPSKTRDTTAFSAFTLFDDTRVVTLQMPEVPIGGVREMRSVEIYNDVRPWVFDFTFGSSEPTELARFIIEVPTGWEIDLVIQGGHVARREERLEGFTRIILEATGVPAFRQEAYGPSVYRTLPNAVVRLKSWQSAAGPQKAWGSDRELSAWLYERYQKLGDRSPELAALTAQVLKEAGAAPTDTDKARALYEYVARKVQYCAVAVGYGGWIPHAPADVHKAQYGDCKDKSNYLRALLLEAGIESQVALVHSHAGFPNTFVLPSLAGTFNHAILAVKLEGGVVYADPTERTVPFGMLPARDCESPALHVSKDGDPLTTTPALGPDRSSELQQFVLTIDPAGRGSGTFAISATGVNAAELQYDLLRGTQKKEALIEKWLDLKMLNVTAVSKVDAAPFANKAVVSGQLKSGQLISRSSGPVSLIRLREFAPRWLPAMVSDEQRLTPFAWRWVDTLTGEFEILLPPGARVSAVPTPVVIDSVYFHYQLSWTSSAGTLRVQRQLVRKQRTISPAQFSGFREAVDQVHVAEARAAVVRFEGAK